MHEGWTYALASSKLPSLVSAGVLQPWPLIRRYALSKGVRVRLVNLCQQISGVILR